MPMQEYLIVWGLRKRLEDEIIDIEQILGVLKRLNDRGVVEEPMKCGAF